MFAVSHGTRLQVGDVGAAARFGDRQRRDLVAGQHRRDELLLLLVGAGMHDRRRADAMRHQAGDHPTAAGAREFLGQHDQIVQVRHFDAAVGFGKADLQQAGVGGLAVQFARQRLLGLPAVDMRRDLALDETADLLAERLVVGREKRMRVGHGDYPEGRTMPDRLTINRCCAGIQREGAP